MSSFHAVVWIDHQEAHVLHFTREGTDNTVVHAHPKHRQTHHRKGVIGGGKVMAVEAADHPSDGELLKLARHYFTGADRMLAQPRT